MHAVTLATLLNTATPQGANQTRSSGAAAIYSVNFYEAPLDSEGDAFWNAMASESESNIAAFWVD